MYPFSFQLFTLELYHATCKIGTSICTTKMMSTHVVGHTRGFITYLKALLLLIQAFVFQYVLNRVSMGLDYNKFAVWLIKPLEI